jgi:hypothetical protein
VSDTLIESGLNDGDRVITGPYKILESLANDQKVKEEAKSATTQPTTAPSTPATQTAALVHLVPSPRTRGEG